MASDAKDGQNKLSKNIREQNLKFSVEFQEGEGGTEQEYEDDFVENTEVTQQNSSERSKNMENKERNGDGRTKKGGSHGKPSEQAQGQQQQRSPIFKTEPQESPEPGHAQRNGREKRRTEPVANSVAKSNGEKRTNENRQNLQTEDPNKPVRTRERMERKRKWNQKTDGENGHKEEEGVKFPPIQNRWSPSQHSPSTAKSKYI